MMNFDEANDLNPFIDTGLPDTVSKVTAGMECMKELLSKPKVNPFPQGGEQ